MRHDSWLLHMQLQEEQGIGEVRPRPRRQRLADNSTARQATERIKYAGQRCTVSGGTCSPKDKASFEQLKQLDAQRNPTNKS